MAREIPEAVRAAAGLAATVLDEARRLPETLPALPVRVLGLAMQLSMKVQQQYAGLVARGDELFTGLRGENEPGLATFDDEDPAGPAGTTGVGKSAFDRVPETVIDVMEDDDTAAADRAMDELAIEELVDRTPTEEGADTPVDLEPGRDADGLLEPEVLAESPAPVEDAPAVVEIEVDVPAPEGVAVVEQIAPDAAAASADVEAAAEAATAPEAPAAETAGPNTLAPPPTPPVEGYDDWSIAQLRGRLRGYAPATVQQLLEYEQRTQNREPYLRMLGNRLERLQNESA
jgi:hypothetical protein